MRSYLQSNQEGEGGSKEGMKTGGKMGNCGYD